MAEQVIHEAVARLLQYAAVVPWRHVPNGEARNPIVGAKLKRMGVKPGVADFHLTLDGGQSGWLEIKAPGKYQSPAQKQFAEAETAMGARYAVAKSVDEAQVILKEWGAIR